MILTIFPQLKQNTIVCYTLYQDWQLVVEVAIISNDTVKLMVFVGTQKSDFLIESVGCVSIQFFHVQQLLNFKIHGSGK